MVGNQGSVARELGTDGMKRLGKESCISRNIIGVGRKLRIESHRGFFPEGKMGETRPLESCWVFLTVISIHP